jgi:hypothetical protein
MTGAYEGLNWIYRVARLIPNCPDFRLALFSKKSSRWFDAFSAGCRALCLADECSRAFLCQPNLTCAAFA